LGFFYYNRYLLIMKYIITESSLKSFIKDKYNIDLTGKIELVQTKYDVPMRFDDYITLSGKIKVYIDIYKSQNRSDFDNIKDEIQYRLEDLLPNIELEINDIIDERKFGPGIDW